MPSDLDAVIEEFTVEDAELVVEELRSSAHWWIGGGLQRDKPDPARAYQLRLIANHLAMEAGKVRMRAEQRVLTPAQSTGNRPGADCPICEGGNGSACTWHFM